MQKSLDIEEHLSSIEQIIFNNFDVEIKKNPQKRIEKSIAYVGGPVEQILLFYENLNPHLLQMQRIGMFSSGTTQGSQTLYFRTKESILKEITEIETFLADLRSKKILIMVTPNHSFGLIPALLTSRRLSEEVYLNVGQAPIEVIQHLFALKPEIIFAVPAHIRLIAEWVKKKHKEISFLKKIIYGGAILQPDLVRFFEEFHITLTSLYGTTQTGVISIQQQVSAEDPHNCGTVLKNYSILFSEEQQEIIILTSAGQKIATGDMGLYKGQDLIVQQRIDNVIFKNGNKIDLKWLENLIKQILEINDVQIQLEKNINRQPEIICRLPKLYESNHRLSFEKIRRFLPPYAIPERFYYV